MEPKIASLGDSPKKNLVLVRETHPLPSSRKDIIMRLGEILGLGKVQKIVLQVGTPIHVDRFVEEDTVGPQPIVEPINDLWLEARNSPMLDFASPVGESSLSSIYRAWQTLIENGCQISAIFTGPNLDFSEWIGIRLNDNEFFGVKIENHKEMPDDSLLLIGTNDLKTISIRVPVDIPKKKGKK